MILIVMVLNLCVGCEKSLQSNNGTTSEEKTNSTATLNHDEESTNEKLTELSTNWEDMMFDINGELYHLSTSYKALEKNGWVVDYENCKYEKDYIMEPGEYTLQSHDIFHDQYQENEGRERFYITMSFYNNTNQKTTWSEASVSCFSASISENTDVVYEINYPSITLANEIAWGATLDEIKAAFGEPQSQKESQYQPTEYTLFYYNNEETKEMTLVVHEKYGLIQIKLQESFNQ